MLSNFPYFFICFQSPIIRTHDITNTNCLEDFFGTKISIDGVIFGKSIIQQSFVDYIYQSFNFFSLEKNS